MNLTDFGWNAVFQHHLEGLSNPAWEPARVAREERHRYLLYADAGELLAELAGRLRHDAASRTDLPAVGDWVAVEARPADGQATIHAVLPRRSAFVRKEAGGHTEPQVVAANVEVAFLVSGLDNDLNLRRIERYLTLAWESGAAPVVLLNKADLCVDTELRIAEVETVAPGVPIHAVSATQGGGLDALHPHLRPGHTAAFLGSSGVGKSTLINRLLGADLLKTRAVREDDSRGRHTTTHRELIPVPGHGVVIDTPGMRELQLWVDGSGLSQAFGDVEGLATQCRFRDCSHQGEPGCAVQMALAEGALPAERWASYLKLRREHRYLERRQQGKVRQAEKAQWRQRAITARRRRKNEEKW